MQDHGEEDVDFFSIGSKYFIHSNFAVGCEVGFGNDIHAFSIQANYRF